MTRTVLLWTLGTTQILGYGTLYYSFGILAEDIGRDFGWSAERVFAAFSAALLAGGLVAPWAGRCFDRFGAGQAMAAGSIAASLALATCAVAPSPAFLVVGLVLIEIAATLVLYEAAFAFIVQADGADAPRRITHLTLIAGFASTLFWPITSALHQFLDWREIYLLFAAVNLALCFPLHLWLARRQPAAKSAAASAGPSADTPDRGIIPPARRGQALLLATIGFSLSGFVLSGLLVHMVPLLSALGLGAAAVTVAAVFGPSQVFIRFLCMAVVRRPDPVLGAMTASGLLALAILALAASAPVFAGAVLFAALLGFGSGLTSIFRGTVPLALFGSPGYGARLGRMTSVRLVLTSVAPFVLALLIQSLGASAALAVLAAVAAGAAGAFVGVAGLSRTRPQEERPHTQKAKLPDAAGLP